MRKQTPHFTPPAFRSRRFDGCKTVAIYARIDGDDDYMLKAQVNELSLFADAHPDFIGWNVATYQDAGSFSKSGKQPQLELLTTAIRAGEVQCVIVKNLSRIARDSLALRYYVEQIFFAYQTRLISLTEHLDTTDPVSLTMLRSAFHRLTQPDSNDIEVQS